MIQSIAGELAGGALSDRRRSAPIIPASMAALVGGGLKVCGRAKCRWPITAFCFSTSCRSLPRPCSTRCASRSKAAGR